MRMVRSMQVSRRFRPQRRVTTEETRRLPPRRGRTLPRRATVAWLGTPLGFERGGPGPGPTCTWCVLRTLPFSSETCFGKVFRKFFYFFGRTPAATMFDRCVAVEIKENCVRESAPLLRWGGRRAETTRTQVGCRGAPLRALRRAKGGDNRLSKDNQTQLRRGRRPGIPGTAPTRLRRVGRPKQGRESARPGVGKVSERPWSWTTRGRAS